MTIEQRTDPPTQGPPPRRPAVLAFTISAGAGIAAFLLTQDAQLSIEVAIYVLGAAESVRNQPIKRNGGG
jgi:hypothetical protein